MEIGRYLRARLLDVCQHLRLVNGRLHPNVVHLSGGGRSVHRSVGLNGRVVTFQGVAVSGLIFDFQVVLTRRVTVVRHHRMVLH